MFSCLQILEAFLWFVLITLLNVTLIILTLSVSRLLNLLLRLVAFLLFLDRKSGSAGMPRPISYAVFCLKKKKSFIFLFNFFFLCYVVHLDLHSFPTRRSSDLIDTLPIVCFHASKSWRLFYGSFLLPF